MPTNNSWNSASPAGVASGGTGLASTTAYGLITGGTTTTGNFQTVTPGTAHTLVTSGGTAALHTYTSALKVTSDVLTNTAQPCFLAYLSASTGSVTGDGTTYQVAFDTVVFDQGSNFTTGASSVFTAPVTGKYFFSTTADFIPGVVATNTFFLRLTATSRGIESFLTYPITATSDVSNTLTVTGIIDMTANDTIKVQAIALNGTKSTSIGGSGTPYLTYFSGYLIC